MYENKGVSLKHLCLDPSLLSAVLVSSRDAEERCVTTLKTATRETTWTRKIKWTPREFISPYTVIRYDVICEAYFVEIAAFG